jgi:hypothetical protein
MTEARLDGVFDTTLSVGTGSLTLAGAFSNKYRRFAGVAPDGSSCVIRIEHATSNIAEWEICDAVYSGGVLTRGAVQSSSNAGAAVSFSAGTKNVALVAVAARMIVQAAAGHVPMPGPPAFPLHDLDGSGGPDYAMTASDYEVLVNKSVSGPSLVTLPLSPVNAQIAIVSDGKGDLDVGGNNITVVGPISGSSTFVLTVSWQVVWFRYSSAGTRWNIIKS